VGWKAWPDEMLDRFEAHWAVGTTPRLVYSLALYFGHRRGDVTRVKPADLKPTFTNVVQQKTGKALILPIHPNLQDVIEAVPDLDKRPFVVMAAWGKPFSAKALGMRMQHWIGQLASRQATRCTASARRWARHWPRTRPRRVS
jgi:hypothetical protein